MSNAIQLHTGVSGHFSVYIPDENNNLELVTQSSNLVVNSGLDAVGTTLWANCLKRCLAGSGLKEVSATDTKMDVLELSSSATSPIPGPACYTIAEYDNTIPDNGITYRIGKTWRLDNNTGITKTIKELGVSTTASGNINLFSRSLVPPFDLPDKRFAYIIYELKLQTGISSARQDFQVTTDGNTDFAFPVGAKLGIFNCPVTYLESNGTVQNTLTADGQSMFEPSVPNYWLYYLKDDAGGIEMYFEPKRDWFESNQTTLLSGNNVASPNPVYTIAHTNGHQFSNDDNGTYVPGSYKRVRHIIISPEVPSIPEEIHGFAVVNQPLAPNVSQRGLHCVFPEAWMRPINAFTKFYFEQTWSAVV